jgi:hypothetical protein
VRATPWIHLAAGAVLLLAGLGELWPDVAWLRDLHGRSLAERGQRASDPALDPLARAGRVQLRRRLEAGAVPASATGDVWRWCFEVSRTLPGDARVWLGVPLTSLYYYASFFWYPAQVDVAAEPVVVRDQQSLARSASMPDRSWLARRGYTHLVTSGPGGLRLVALTGDGS